MIDASETLDQLAGAFSKYPIEFGFEHALLLVLDEGHNQILKHQCMTSLSKRLRTPLQEYDFLKKNPIIEAANCGQEIIIFSSLQGSSLSKLDQSEENESIAELAGVALQVTLASELRVLCILTTRKNHSWIAKEVNNSLKEMKILAYEFTDCFVHLSRVSACQVPSLSEDEKRFLRLLISYEDPRVALEFNYSFGSAINLQTSIARKLGVKTIYQALSVAIKRHMLPVHTLAPNEIVHSQTQLAGVPDPDSY